MIKIVHMADLHVGLEFSRYPAISQLLKEERLRAIRVIVERANKESVHAIVIAGDLFDKLSVTQRVVREVKAVLAAFSGEVFVIPGNHDWYNLSATENKVWDWFTSEPGANVHFLNEQHSYNFSINNKEVVFYACGCDQKHSEDHRVGWVRDYEKNTSAINIGIAHGNVEGYGLDEEGRYFNMTPEELRESGLDCWLLGHIHAPYPKTETAAHENFFFSGNHCSDSWKSNRGGGAWLIEIDDNKNFTAIRWQHEGICFKDLKYEVSDSLGWQYALSELNSLNADQTVLRLLIYGSLEDDESQLAKQKLEEKINEFLYGELVWNVQLNITMEKINQLYPSNSIPYMLLNELNSSGDVLATQLGYETIKSMSDEN